MTTKFTALGRGPLVIVTVESDDGYRDFIIDPKLIHEVYTEEWAK